MTSKDDIFGELVAITVLGCISGVMAGMLLWNPTLISWDTILLFMFIYLVVILVWGNLVVKVATWYVVVNQKAQDRW